MSIAKSPLARAVLIAAALATSACATVTRGTKEVFVVETTPSGARVELSTGQTCKATPCAFQVARKSEFTAKISKPGFLTTEHRIITQVAREGAMGMAGNLLAGGFIGAGIGAGVDYYTGAHREFLPNPLVIVLERAGS